jgi:8-oxo-dGTP diphosphatase
LSYDCAVPVHRAHDILAGQGASMTFLDPRNLPYTLLRWIPLRGRPFWRLVSLLNARFLSGVNGLVSDDSGRILVCHHTYRRRRPWGLPGGWMMAGETPLATLEREVCEETGLQVNAERLLLIGTCPDRPKLEFVVAGRLIEGEFRRSREVDAIRWWLPGEKIALPHRQRSMLAHIATLPPGEVGYYSMPWDDPERD